MDALGKSYKLGTVHNRTLNSAALSHIHVLCYDCLNTRWAQLFPAAVYPAHHDYKHDQ
jgi:hypothetical protein